jgi:hypothetical protein
MIDQIHDRIARTYHLPPTPIMRLDRSKLKLLEDGYTFDKFVEYNPSKSPYYHSIHQLNKDLENSPGIISVIRYTHENDELIVCNETDIFGNNKLFKNINHDSIIEFYVFKKPNILGIM